MRDCEVKVMDLEKVKFWLKFLEAKRDSDELCCPAAALNVFSLCSIFILLTQR